MIFLHPNFLYYILPPLFIFFLFLLRHKESELNYFSKDIMEKLRVSSGTMTLKIRNYIFLFISLLVIVSLANPVINDGKIEVKAKSADIMIALDISDSMLAEDVYPNRLKLAKQKALSLLKLAPNERIGVIGFAKNSYLVSPLSFDHGAVRFLLKQLNTDSITEKGTNFLSLLEVVQKSVKNDAKKYLLLFSDGGDKDDFTQEIEYAKEHNIVIFILAFGTEKGAPIKMEDGSFIKQNGNIIVSKLNKNIVTLATKTGGVYMKSINSNEDVTRMMAEIEEHSVKKELKSHEIHKYIPLFYYPLGMAVFLLLIATSSLYKRENAQKSLLVLFVLIFVAHQKAEASLLDFVELKNAKEAYAAKDYKESQNIYDKYLKSSNNSNVNYNIGNALYKQGKYKEAIKSYKQAHFDEVSLKAKNLANIGNAYAKEPKEENLKKAIEAYENSLQLKEDKDTKENLEAVKKALKKKKEKKKDKKNKKDKKKQDKKQDKQKQNKKSDKKEKQKQKKNSDKKSDKKEEQKQKKNADKDTDKKEQKKDKNKEKQKNAKENSVKAKKEKQKMSESEEKKWLKKLNKQQGTFLYRLNDKTSKKENENEKPW